MPTSQIGTERNSFNYSLNPGKFLVVYALHHVILNVFFKPYETNIQNLDDHSCSENVSTTFSNTSRFAHLSNRTVTRNFKLIKV